MSQGVSLNPDSAAVGGTLDGIEATITRARAQGEYPNGTPAVLLSVTFAPAGGAKERTELYSMGKAQLKPSADGKQFLPLVEGAKPHKGCSGIQFLVALIQAGFPADRIGNDVSVIEGTTVFLRAKPRPKTGNAEIDKNNEGKTITLPDRVSSLPGEGASAKKSPAAPKKPVAAKAAPAAAATPVAEAEPVSGDFDADGEAVKFVAAILAAADNNTVARNQIGGKVFGALAKHKPALTPEVRKAILNTINKAGFYEADDRPWFVDAEARTLIGQPSEEVAEAA